MMPFYYDYGLEPEIASDTETDTTVTFVSTYAPGGYAPAEQNEGEEAVDFAFELEELFAESDSWSPTTGVMDDNEDAFAFTLQDAPSQNASSAGGQPNGPKPTFAEFSSAAATASSASAIG